jgi:purine-binding chemotaxis protein CheW
VPNVPTWVRGVINLRGDILSVIDVRTFLGMEEGQPLESSRLLVVKSAGEDITTSLIVDQVTGIVPLPTAPVEFSSALFEDSVAPYIRGVYEHKAQALAVFDLERFLLSPELRQFE